jgi:hypothetical protein
MISMRGRRIKIAFRAVLVLTLVSLVTLAVLPFFGPRNSGLKKAGVWCYRSYQGGNWFGVGGDSFVDYRFRVSEETFREVCDALNLKRTSDDKVFMHTRETFTRGGAVHWFRMPWNDDLELYSNGYRLTLCRNPHTGLCLMVSD